jgi:hypothetical protein
MNPARTFVRDRIQPASGVNPVPAGRGAEDARSIAWPAVRRYRAGPESVLPVEAGG